MIVIRQKKFSGYQPSYGVSYTSAQVRDGINDGAYALADTLERTADYVSEVNPVVGKASKRLRDRITGYTRPLKKLIKRQKQEK